MNMIAINLLPWREQLRFRLRRQFWMQLCIGSACSLCLILGIGLYIKHQITEQSVIHQQLMSAIGQLKAHQRGVRFLIHRHRLAINVEETMQRDYKRAQRLVHVLASIGDFMPCKLVLNQLATTLDGDVLLIGQAQTSSAIASLMQDLKQFDALDSVDVRINDDKTWLSFHAFNRLLLKQPIFFRIRGRFNGVVNARNTK